jgi:hypothetical protein
MGKKENPALFKQKYQRPLLTDGTINLRLQHDNVVKESAI